MDILCQCRQTLMCTYVFAYYLRKNNQSMIFEDNQKDLETATEKLSEYLERDITSENLADIKQQVQDKYRYVSCVKFKWNTYEFRVITLISVSLGTARSGETFYWITSTKVMKKIVGTILNECQSITPAQNKHIRNKSSFLIAQYLHTNIQK